MDLRTRNRLNKLEENINELMDDNRRIDGCINSIMEIIIDMKENNKKTNKKKDTKPKEEIIDKSLENIV